MITKSKKKVRKNVQKCPRRAQGLKYHLQADADSTAPAARLWQTTLPRSPAGPD